MQEEHRGLTDAFPEGRSVFGVEALKKGWEDMRRPEPQTSTFEAGAKGRFGYWKIEFTPRLTPEQWDLFREVIEKHNAFVGGVYSKAKVIAALHEIVPEAEIVG